MKNNIFRLIAVLISISLSLHAGGQIVVNIGSNVSELNKDDAKAIFNLQKTVWDNGTPIKVYLLPSTHETEIEFCKNILDSEADVVFEKWMAYVFNGGANKPPKSMKMKKVMKNLKKKSGAIGILPTNVKLPKNTISVLKF